MSSLGDVVGALVSQIARGRSQADLATLEIAQIYKNTPLLSEFPIPRFSLDEVVVDLKIAVNATPLLTGFITREALAEILTRLRGLVSELPNMEPILQSPEFTGFHKAWKSAQGEVFNRLSDLLPIGGQPDSVSTLPPIGGQPDSVSTLPPTEGQFNSVSTIAGSTSIIRGHLIQVLASSEAQVPIATVRKLIKVQLPVLEKNLETRIRNMIEEVLKSQVLPRDRFDVLVTASELQTIPPEKITTMKLTLRESDQAWTHYTTEDGQRIEKLLPA